jgi:hypothetical protein
MNGWVLIVLEGKDWVFDDVEPSLEEGASEEVQEGHLESKKLLTSCQLKPYLKAKRLNLPQ